MEENFEIQELLESKDFDELNGLERKLVLMEITEEDYKDRRKVIDSIRLLLVDGVNKTRPKGDVRRNVLAVMQAKNTSGFFGKVILYRIPVYVPAAAAILVALLIPFLFHEANADKISQEKPSSSKIIYKTRTIEKEVPKIVEVEKVKYIKVPVNENQMAISSSPLEENTGEYTNPELTFSEEQVENQLNVLGRTSTSHSDLNRFLVVGN